MLDNNKSRYSLKEIDTEYLKATGNKENIENDSNVVFMPYLMVTNYEIDEKTICDIEYDNFMNEYHKKHSLCPNCKSDYHITRLDGYILNMNNKEDYKDLNKCECLNCNHKHTVHDRIEK